ncbi:hypothetical protein [Furfurilactobacillus siliginis]|uniref:Uncharacterized protein n=1 Tax=Furfurilactobacillus siliginis TaxID=348151 RepID=A0A0R2KUR6_9LACO|nr:hypothetical protein [Furfurilactobacillus siliginis]KRN93243.1 hypothetical protein IV55_GL001066 [Furfurilactobacillus siliginis]GEK29641.1 hypothetical protein LSI01_19520 [Furfurilactobacillus siliginis]
MENPVVHDIKEDLLSISPEKILTNNLSAVADALTDASVSGDREKISKLAISGRSLLSAIEKLSR